MNIDKTNVIHILDQKDIFYKYYIYSLENTTSNQAIADILGKSITQIYKTLMTVSEKGAYRVFVIPINAELDLKKAGRAVKDKNLRILEEKKLLFQSGYTYAECSPIGMRKYFPTVIDSSALTHETIVFNAGRAGCQVEISLQSLEKVIAFKIAPLCVDTAESCQEQK